MVGASFIAWSVEIKSIYRTLSFDPSSPSDSVGLLRSRNVSISVSASINLPCGGTGTRGHQFGRDFARDAANAMSFSIAYFLPGTSLHPANSSVPLVQYDSGQNGHPSGSFMPLISTLIFFCLHFFLSFAASPRAGHLVFAVYFILTTEGILIIVQGEICSKAPFAHTEKL